MKKEYRRKSSLTARKALLLLSGGLLLAASAAASAETLSEADIRALYKDAQDAVRTPSKTIEIMKARLDDNFLLVAHVSRTLGNSPAESGDQKLSKTALISRTLQSYGMIKIDDYQQNIVDIKFSDDGKWGYVSRTTVMRGEVQVSMPDNKTGIANYSDAEACVDTLGLQAGSLKTMHSECKAEIKLSPPK